MTFDMQVQPFANAGWYIHLDFRVLTPDSWYKNGMCTQVKPRIQSKPPCRKETCPVCAAMLQVFRRTLPWSKFCCQWVPGWFRKCSWYKGLDHVLAKQWMLYHFRSAWPESQLSVGPKAPYKSAGTRVLTICQSSHQSSSKLSDKITFVGYLGNMTVFCKYSLAIAGCLSGDLLSIRFLLFLDLCCYSGLIVSGWNIICIRASASGQDCGRNLAGWVSGLLSPQKHIRFDLC